MNILIPNATSPKNIGDEAMLLSLLTLIRHSYPHANILIHSIDPRLQRKYIRQKTKHSLVSWLSLEKRNFWIRLMRVIAFLLQYIFPAAAIDKKLKRILTDYTDADLIIFVGNGYLRASRGVSQTVFLLLQLLPFILAQKSSKSVIITAPMGFGPFAHWWQRSVCAWILKGLSQLSIRDPISLALAKRTGLHRAKLSWDHALLLPTKAKRQKAPKPPVLGVALRSWFTGNKQQKFETTVFEALISFARQSNTIIWPIAQVHAPEYGDDDLALAKRLYQYLKYHNVPTRKPAVLQSSVQGQQIYSSLTVLLGMRMHANILASGQYVPFVAIAYEHKTMGIAKQLGMQRLCLEAENIDATQLTRKLIFAYKGQKQLRSRLSRTVKIIRERAQKQWDQLLRY